MHERAGQRDGEEHAGEGDEEEGDPVDPELPRDAERPDPDVLGDELEARVGLLELEHEVDAERGDRDGGGQADDPNQLRPPPRHDGDRERAGRGQDDERRQVGEAHESCTLVTTQPSTSTAPITTPRA